MKNRVPLLCTFSHRTRPPEMFNEIKNMNWNQIDCVMFLPPLNCIGNPYMFCPIAGCPYYHVASIGDIYSGTLIMSRSPTSQSAAQTHLQPQRKNDYRAYIPVQVGDLQTVAYVDSGNSFANANAHSTRSCHQHHHHEPHEPR